MTHFVQGVLTLEDDIYLSDPDLRLANGKLIPILYDDIRTDEERSEEADNAVISLLEKDKWFEFLLIARINRKKVIYYSQMPANKKLELTAKEIPGSLGERKFYNMTQGIILDLDWDAASQPFLAVGGSVVYTRRYVLVETAMGKIVLSYKVLEERLGEDVITQLQPGGYLEWERARLDILAIIDKRDSEPGE